ncbi:MAG: carbohydrate binding family 9 domain-containing protein [Gemmatimonadetes bacterium]|nr:carbohydrate binding family 9 domain-containing protein [Gemmatimonadota bacterium]
MQRRILFLLAIALIRGAADLGAQNAAADATARAINPETAPRPSTPARKATRVIKIDGRLDDADWASAPVLTNFVQQLPRTGFPATFRTTVRILYDADHIYVGAVNHDPDPSKAITVGLERDFNSGNSDIFGLVLDTFHDRRNSFLFLINPKGAVRDEQTYNDSRTIVDAWEGVINVRTSTNDSSWIAEIEIPTRTLRFDASKGTQDWGLNLIRRVRRVNETSYWAPLERQYRVHRMSKAGTLTGLEGLTQGRNIQLKPYGMTSNSRGAQVPSTAVGSQADGGFDVKYGVTPSLTLDATYNTDFSQVEVDQEQVNLTRFSLFFPERREFFIENAGAVQFGDVQERNLRTGATLRDFTLFNSRRIGLTSDGRPLPIVAGGRLSGRIGGTEVGAVNMQTGAALGQPAENFSVARLRRNIFGSSDVGVMVLNRQGTDTSKFNTSFGFDANIRPLPNTVINSYYARSEANGSSSDGDAARVSIGYRDTYWNSSAMWKQVGDDFNPGLGFVRRTGMRQAYGTVGIHPRPRVRGLQEVNPYVEVDYITDTRSRLQSRTLSFGTEVFFQPDGKLSLDFNDQFDRVDARFTVLPGAAIDPGAYSFREATVRYTAGQARKVFGNASVSGGGYYGGDRRTYSGGLTWRPRYDFSLETSYQRNNITLKGDDFHADVAALRARYAWSTRLFGSAYVQYNTQNKSYVTNARINFRWAPLSDVFVVFTDRRNSDTRALNERSVVLKVTRMVAF